MNRDERYKLNDTAFRRLKPVIDKQFPVGHFVALDDGVIIADAASFNELHEKLTAAGRNDPDVFVAQAGVDYPEFAYILIPTTSWINSAFALVLRLRQTLAQSLAVSFT